MKILLIPSLVLATTAARGAEYKVVPNAQSTAAANSSFTGPLASNQLIYQILINQNQVTSLVGKTMTGLTFRIPTNSGSNWPTTAVTFETYDIFMGQCVAPSAMSLSNFNNNRVGALTQVRSGPMTIAAASFPPRGPSLIFGPDIAFQTNFVYLGGHMLVELRHSGFLGSSRTVEASSLAAPGWGTDFSSCFDVNYFGTSGSSGNVATVRLRAEPPPTLTLSGAVTLVDYSAAPAGRSIQFALKSVSSTATIHSVTATLGTGGSYSFTIPGSISPGSYHLFADGSPFLKRKTPFTLTASGATGINFSLPNGDCDNSGEVDAADIDAVIAAFGLINGSPGYSLSVDVDGSTEVDAADIDVVISNFGATDD